MNPSTALATVLVAALRELGVRHAVLCPGSRSSALAYALAAADAGAGPDRLRLHVRVDERAAGFLALGLGKESGFPAVVVTTSGTAVANLHPAVLEAAHAGVPLLVLSADRPHELRGTGANQTTDQVKLFGTAVRLFAEIPAPADPPTGSPLSSAAAVGWRNTMARAVAAALGRPAGQPGPAHVNVAFREPLVPGDMPAAPIAVPAREGLTREGLTRVEARGPAAPVVLQPGPRTVVLAGDGAGPAAVELALAGGWPLLAEPSSGARRGGQAIGPYRLLLDVPGLGAAVERVVVYGHPTLSRPVTRLLARQDVEVVVVSARADWPDAPARAARVIPSATVDGPAGGSAATVSWLRRWQQADRAARSAIDAVLDAELAAGRFSGAVLARELAAALRPGEALVVGASNAVRDLDLAAAAFEGGVDPFDVAAAPVVLANRGLAGIDGTLSTAAGVALARAQAGGALPVRALVGDLTFLHDSNALLIGPHEQRPQLQVVLLDDAGGGIFGLLEPGERAALGAAEAAVFERVFTTPVAVDVQALCAAHGVGYDRPAVGGVGGVGAEGAGGGVGGGDPVAALRAALARPRPGISVLHLHTDRRWQRPLAARIATAVAAVQTG